MFTKQLDLSFNKLKNLFSEANKRDQLTEDVYHYTAKDKLIEILKSRKFFMRNLKEIKNKSYETDELRCGLKHLKNLIPEKNFLLK